MDVLLPRAFSAVMWDRGFARQRLRRLSLAGALLVGASRGQKAKDAATGERSGGTHRLTGRLNKRSIPRLPTQRRPASLAPASSGEANADRALRRTNQATGRYGLAPNDSRRVPFPE